MHDKWCVLCDHPAEWDDETERWLHEDADLDSVCGEVAVVELPAMTEPEPLDGEVRG